jgi:hypothetical protein
MPLLLPFSHSDTGLVLTKWIETEADQSPESTGYRGRLQPRCRSLHHIARGLHSMPDGQPSSLLLPTLVEVMLIGAETRRYFSIVNFRMMTVPSGAMDIYNELFARHDLTYFCQAQILIPFVTCPYEHPLVIEMENNYAVGTFNASLFATAAALRTLLVTSGRGNAQATAAVSP